MATLDADKDGVTFEGSLPEEIGRASLFGQASDLVEELPGDSWLGMAQTDFGKLIDFYVDAFAGMAGGRDTIEQQLKAATGLDLQKDVIDWMGDFGVFVRGTSVSELDGALIVETKDEAASGALHLGARAAREDPGTGRAAHRPAHAPPAAARASRRRARISRSRSMSSRRTARWSSPTAMRPPPMP